MTEPTFRELWEGAYCEYVRLLKSINRPITPDQNARLNAYDEKARAITKNSGAT